MHSSGSPKKTPTHRILLSENSKFDEEFNFNHIEISDDENDVPIELPLTQSRAIDFSKFRNPQATVYTSLTKTTKQTKPLVKSTKIAEFKQQSRMSHMADLNIYRGPHLLIDDFYFKSPP
jgi:hypothetical protein